MVRDSIYDTVQIVKNSGEIFYWFTCSICSNILFCASYIPPEGSTNSGISLFDDLGSDLLEFNQNIFNQNNSHVCLLGDFNARTGNNYDFVPFDENIEQFSHMMNRTD